MWLCLYLLTVVVGSHSMLTDKPSADEELPGDVVGCFQHSLDSQTIVDFPLRINGTATAQNVNSCVTVCKENYFRYAGIVNGQYCLCGSQYGSQGPGDCGQYCYGNASQLCGGLHAVSVYTTGFMIPGPPKNITVNQTSDTRIVLQWDQPDAPNGNIIQYQISVNVRQTWSSTPLPVRSWTVPATIRRTALLSLHPGTLYNLSIAGVNQYGIGPAAHLLAWTHIAEPPQPESPEVVKKEQGTITVRLKPVNNEFGPISKYRLVVSSEEDVLLTESCLKSWSEAEHEKLAYYIAAELDPQDVTNMTEVVVGDGKRHGGFYNPPLQSKGESFVRLGVISSFQDITLSSYSSSVHSHHGVILLHVPLGTESSADGLTKLLWAAIIVCGLLLVTAILLYIAIQYKYGNRHYIRDTQELNLRGPVTQVENSAFVYDEYLPEEEENERVDYYDMLHQRIWNIPRNFLDFQSEIMCEGNFGKVHRGTVNQDSRLTTVAVYAIRDRELDSDDKRSMLEGLDVLVRGGDHPHTLSLTGTCESQNTLYVVLEHHPASLKDLLLQSRSLNHQHHNKARFCSLTENTFLDFIICIAQGMNYLASKKIVHKALRCSNILMADGVTPKITGFGLAHYSRTNRKQDNTRWAAREVFARRLNVTKSDVWSFGVLLWEACALGGTPYREVPSEQVAGAILRGARLPQLSYMGDTLYQLMLSCWQVDLDERPDFSFILSDIDAIRSSPEMTIELNFNRYKDFQYEDYTVDLEYY